MAKTLLNCVNEILKRVGQIHGDSDALVVLTSGARQRSIDVSIQVINEGIDELYSTSALAMPNEVAESTITLATNDKDYALASDLVALRWPLIDKTNNQYIYKFPGSYNDMLLLDPEQDDTGTPYWGVISPVNSQLFLDRKPDASVNGNIYTYQYDKELELTDAADTVPFNNAVFRAMVPAWVQLYRRSIQNDFDEAIFRASMGRASRLLTQEQPRQDWCPR